MSHLSGSMGGRGWCGFALLAACLFLPACRRQNSADLDPVAKAEAATASAREAHRATELAKTGLESDIAREMFRMLATAKTLAPQLTDAESVWLKAGVTECAYPPTEKTPAQRLQAIRDFQVKLKDELRRRQ